MNSKMKEPALKSNHHKKRIHAGWILAVMIPLIIVMAGLFAVSKYLYGVEYYSPTGPLEKYVELIRSKDYVKAMEFVGLKETPFNTVKEYENFFKTSYGDSVESFVFIERKLQRTEQNVFYDVRINKKESQKFKLTKTGEKKLIIFDTWNMELIQTIAIKTVVIEAPPDIVISLNGTVVPKDLLLPGSEYSLDYFKNVQDDKTNLTMSSYQIKDIVAISSIEAKTASGELCEVTLLEEKENISTYVVRKPIPKTQEDELKTLVEKITKKYSEFVAKDVGFSALSPYLYKNTKLYTDLKSFYNGWFTPHQSYGFEDVKFFDMQSFDETHCAVGIEFTYFVYKFDQRFDYPVKYNVYLIKIDNSWLVADLSIQGGIV